MKRSFFIFSIFYFVFASIQVNAQNSGQLTSGQEPPRERRRQALVLDIESRVLGEGQKVIWSETNRKVSIPGIPVGVQLEGSNIVLVVQFTPYIRSEGNVLVAQGQIWIAGSDKSVTYYTSIQTIPMEIGEPILFYPLGSSQQYLNPSIEIVITINPYNGEPRVRPETPARLRDGR